MKVGQKNFQYSLVARYTLSISCITVTIKGEACVHLTFWIIKEKFYVTLMKLLKCILKGFAKKLA